MKDSRFHGAEVENVRCQREVVSDRGRGSSDDDQNGSGKRASIHPCKPFDIDTNHSLNTIMRAWDDFFILYPS